MKFLIIRFSSIGDIVLTSPVIRCIKKKYPDSDIHYLTKKAYYPVLKSNPNIDHFHLFDNSLFTSIQILKKEKFDVIIDLHKNLRTFIVKSFLLKKSYSFNKLNIKKWILVNFKINFMPDNHIVDRYFEGLRKLEIKNDDLGLDYFIPLDEFVDFKVWPEEFRKDYIVLVTGAKQNTKMIPVKKCVEICNKSEFPVILLGGKEDIPVALKITENCNKRLLNLCGKLNINQSALVIKNAYKVITPDTGLMHIAAAFKKKIISIWGNTVPEFGMYPYYGNYFNKNLSDLSTIVEIKGLKCRPCSKIGYKSCPEKHFKCMNDIDVEKFC